MNAAERAEFDRLLEQVLDSLPPRIHELLDEAPLIVDDRPSPEMLEELGIEQDDDDILCGLHTGTPLTERSVDQPDVLPETIHLFRDGILEHAGGWDRVLDDDGAWIGGEDRILEEIRITVLHEIGHHFGLDEGDLAELGYE